MKTIKKETEEDPLFEPRYDKTENESEKRFKAYTTTLCF